LEQTCGEHEIDDAHCIGCGFEDEAPALTQWKRDNRRPRTLTIHCQSEGDLISYGPAADELL